MEDCMFGISDGTEPKNWEEARHHPAWVKATDEEIEALEKNGTWKIIARRPEMRVVGVRTLYKQKLNKDGEPGRKKARVVAKGYTQYGVSFNDRYAPTLRIASLRAILALAQVKGRKVLSADINNAYLHGPEDDEVYMEIPESMRDKYDPSKYVCDLQKSIYGLKTAGRNWNKCFDKYMESKGYRRCRSDPCVYMHHQRDVIVCVYVDDVVCTAAREKDGYTFLQGLRARFGIKEMGELDFVLGISVTKIGKDLIMSQEAYAKRILIEYKMQNCKGVTTPMAPSVKLTKDEEGPGVDQEKYRSIIGKIAYLATCTRPDLAYTVSKLSRYLNDPKRSHMLAVEYALRYIKRTLHYGLRFTNAGTDMKMYVDADHAGCLDTRRSTSGCLIIFGGNLIHWRSKRQTIAVKSSAIAEYVALSEGLDELLWMRNLFLELDVKLGSSMVYEDNTACIRIAENPILSQKTKAVDLHFHYCRDHLQRGIYMLEYIPTDQQLADGLTKAVSGATLFKLAEAYLDTEAHVAPTKSAAEVDAGRSGASRGSVNVYRTYKLN
ncbi:hypothetical protein AAMO2058_001551200 [Amorphochlora amoebiformis]